MATTTSPRTPWLYFTGSILMVLAACLITFTDLAWRGLLGWALLLVALGLTLTGGAQWRRQRVSSESQ
ncbi:hypothetical protein EAE32_01995 [Kocuria tytonicola]|uniref:Uncharacterized protein n=1 Tax=Kocuria tytonicola TaxID=2055946 RepID=A0A3L9L5T2_9MICC|nr:hypothetical protein [Kocuria tytonicola]RLY94035.1 hypothetical protein EAE32_01995 [Kocuria tytonicola]